METEKDGKEWSTETGVRRPRCFGTRGEQHCGEKDSLTGFPRVPAQVMTRRMTLTPSTGHLYVTFYVILAKKEAEYGISENLPVYPTEGFRYN